MAYHRIDGFITLWVSHTFSTSYHSGEGKTMGRGQEIFVTHESCSKRVDFCKVRVILFPMHHLFMSFVFISKAVWDKTFFCQRLQTMTTSLMFLCKGTDAMQQALQGLLSQDTWERWEQIRPAPCTVTYFVSCKGKNDLGLAWCLRNNILYKLGKMFV